MQLYPENYDVTVTALFTDLNGAAVTPTAVSAVLYDGDDAVVVDFGSLPFDVAEGKKEIVIPAAFNVLGADELQAARILRITLETAAGEIRRSSSYIIQGEIRLEVMNNSFVTLEAAEIIARDIPNLTGWASASDDDRYAGLINAYNRLIRIPMCFRSEETPLYYTGSDAGDLPWIDRIPVRRDPHNVPETIILAQAWQTIDKDEFMSFPTHFRKAVRMAQVLEASNILENDVIERRHAQGIISETVGESSIMLRGGRLDVGVSKPALESLRGYIYYSFRLQRA